MMLFYTKYPCVVTGTSLNITEQEIVDVKRNFLLVKAAWAIWAYRGLYGPIM